MYIDDPELRRMVGVSDELTEHTQCEAVVYNDPSDYHWSFYIHPPTERNDLIYFQIYDNAYNNGPVCFNASKIARISMIKPEYIRCNDSSIDEWFLTDDEIDHLIELLNMRDQWIWEILKTEFKFQREAFDEVVINTEHLEMPDYSKLKGIRK